MRKRPARKTPNAPEKRCFCINGRWHWRPDKRLRPHWKGVALGENYTVAMAEGRRLNKQAQAWLDARAAAGDVPKRIRTKAGPLTIGTLIRSYMASADWKRLRPRTAKQYVYEFKRLEAEFGHDNAVTLTETRVDDWIDDMRLTAPAAGRAYASKGRLLYEWAGRKSEQTGVPRGLNPFKGARLGGGGKRKARLFGEHLRIVVAACDGAGYPSIGTAWVIGFAAVQRISDVITLRREHIVSVGNFERLRFTQSKGQHLVARGERGKTVLALEGGFDVDMLLPDIIAQRLAIAPPPAIGEGALIVREGKRAPRRLKTEASASAVRDASAVMWDEKEISRAWRKLRETIAATAPTLAYVADLQMRDARRSGFVQHVLDGCTVELVCSMSGHSIEEGYAIVEHYLPKTPDQADRAVAKLSVRL